MKLGITFWVGAALKSLLCVIAAAVCDFCKKKESELYQKEVGKTTDDIILSFVDFFHNKGCNYLVADNV